jgi:protein gp37
MGDNSRISWTMKTWNPFIGCRKVSAECEHCYAESMINRLRDTPEQKADGYKGLHAFDTVVRTKTMHDPITWQKKAEAAGRYDLVFTCSLSDFFIQQADQWRPEIWRIIKATPNLIYQILTKRPELIEKRLPPDWGVNGYPNCWLGTSVGMKKFLKRMDVLRKTPAHVRFVSAEPLLEDLCPELQAHIDGFHQIIVGGESGNNSDLYRPMDHNWARRILKICRTHHIAYWFKQSSARKTELGTQLAEIEGAAPQTIQEYPAAYFAYKAAPKLF